MRPAVGVASNQTTGHLVELITPITRGWMSARAAVRMESLFCSARDAVAIERPARCAASRGVSAAHAIMLRAGHEWLADGALSDTASLYGAWRRGDLSVVALAHADSTRPFVRDLRTESTPVYLTDEPWAYVIGHGTRGGSQVYEPCAAAIRLRTVTSMSVGPLLRSLPLLVA